MASGSLYSIWIRQYLSRFTHLRVRCSLLTICAGFLVVSILIWPSLWDVYDYHHVKIYEVKKHILTQIPPCGEICSYRGRERKKGKAGYQQLSKTINCQNILGRMAWDKYEVIYPPPIQPPPKLLEEFTQNGLLPLHRNKYFINFSPNATKKEKVFSRKMIDRLQEKQARGVNISTYHIGDLISKTLKENEDFIKDKIGFVIGTLGPWVEVTVLNYDPMNVTTLEYANIRLNHPKLSVYHPALYAKKFLAGGIEPFDFGVSFSSLEHSGLGRYGDPLNPYGDLEAMAQAWCLTKPGGLFILGLPCTKNMIDPAGYIEWNANRVYGPARLSQMTANWELLDIRAGPDIYKLFVLKRI